MGWHEQGDGKLFLGINVEQGRVKDYDLPLQSAPAGYGELPHRIPLTLTLILTFHQVRRKSSRH